MKKQKKTFDVRPSTYVTDYVDSTIKNPYIKTQVDNALKLVIVPKEEVPQPTSVTEEQKEETCAQLVKII